MKRRAPRPKATPLEGTPAVVLGMKGSSSREAVERRIEVARQVELVRRANVTSSSEVPRQVPSAPRPSQVRTRVERRRRQS